MPSRPPTACPRAGCRGLVHSGTCSVCGPIIRPGGWTDWHQQRGTASRQSRGYGVRWERIRAQVLAERPLCAVCGRAASDVDHIVPRAQGGSDAATNLQPLCAACHRAKTAREHTNASGAGRGG